MAGEPRDLSTVSDHGVYSNGKGSDQDLMAIGGMPFDPRGPIRSIPDVWSTPDHDEHQVTAGRDRRGHRPNPPQHGRARLRCSRLDSV